MTDSEKTALAVSGAVAALAVIYFLAEKSAPPANTDQAGNITLSSPQSYGSGGGTPGLSSGNMYTPPYFSPGAPTLTSNPSNANPTTGIADCNCGCSGSAQAMANTVASVTAAYASYLQTAEGQLISSIVNNYVEEAYPGSLDVGENGNNYELIYS
jgi:hypothetical protein